MTSKFTDEPQYEYSAGVWMISLGKDRRCGAFVVTLITTWSFELDHSEKKLCIRRGTSADDEKKNKTKEFRYGRRELFDTKHPNAQTSFSWLKLVRSELITLKCLRNLIWPDETSEQIQSSETRLKSKEVWVGDWMNSPNGSKRWYSSQSVGNGL